MHAAVLQLAPILGAEKSKVPFYIAGGVLVAWALIVSLGLGMRRRRRLFHRGGDFVRRRDQRNGVGRQYRRAQRQRRAEGAEDRERSAAWDARNPHRDPRSSMLSRGSAP